MEEEYIYMNEEINFYRGLAAEIKPEGFRCFLHLSETSEWLYIITPNNSWLSIDFESDGLNIVYHYEPSREFGQGCRCNEDSLREITAETLLEAERFGKNFGHRGWINVPNRYDGGTHREIVWRAPKYHENAYKAMMQSWCAKQLIEL